MHPTTPNYTCRRLGAKHTSNRDSGGGRAILTPLKPRDGVMCDVCCPANNRKCGDGAMCAAPLFARFSHISYSYGGNCRPHVCFHTKCWKCCQNTSQIASVVAGSLKPRNQAVLYVMCAWLAHVHGPLPHRDTLARGCQLRRVRNNGL